MKRHFALVAVSLFAFFLTKAHAEPVCIFQRADGQISVKVINPKFGLATAALCQAEAAKRQKFSGAQFLGQQDRATLPWSADPDARKYRRGAYRWNGSQLMDDRKITTPNEVAETLRWKEEESIKKAPAARSGLEEKVLLRRADLLTPAELKQMVSDWRGSGKAPGPSAFTPPADAQDPPHPGRGR